VNPVLLVDLERAEKQRFLGHGHCGEAEDRSDKLGDPCPADLVDRLEDVHDLRNDQIDDHEILGVPEEPARLPRLLGRIAGQVTDENVRVDEGAQPRI